MYRLSRKEILQRRYEILREKFLRGELNEEDFAGGAATLAWTLKYSRSRI